MKSWLIVLSLLGTGCGSGTVTVHGAVSYDGKPVESGSIELVPDSGRGTPVGAVIRHGQFECKVPIALVGKKSVHISAAIKSEHRIEPGPLSPSRDLVPEIKRVRFPVQSAEISHDSTQAINFDIKP